MYVKAGSGLKVPLEGKPNTYITDGEIVSVEDSAYYLRRVTDGDCIEATEADYQAQIAAAEKSAKAKITTTDTGEK